MSCNCIDQITQRLTEKGYEKVSIGNRAFMLDTYETVMHGTFKHEITLKNGKKRMKETNITFSHCPFCGREYKREEMEHE